MRININFDEWHNEQIKKYEPLITKWFVSKDRPIVSQDWEKLEDDYKLFDVSTVLEKNKKCNDLKYILVI